MQALIPLLVSGFTFLSALGLDRILSKWMAVLTVAYEKVASEKALNDFHTTRSELGKNMAEKAKSWDDWRNSK